MHGPEFLIVGGSVRSNRRGPTIARWVADLTRGATGAAFRLVDLPDLGLSLDDESRPPALGDPYASPATERWGAMVRAATGIIFVTPQYNWGYPAALKNALDHLYREWDAKPALIITYGGHGGGKCADQLRQVIEGGLHMRVVEAMPALPLSRERIVADDGAVDPATDFAGQREAVVDALKALVALAVEASRG